MASTATLVILFPLFLVMFMAIVQWGLYFHAQAQVTAAAQDAVRAASGVDGTEADGESVAYSLLSEALDSGLVQLRAVTVTRDDGVARAEVEAEVRSLVPVPGFEVRVRGVSQSRVEQFVAEPGR